MSSIPSRRSGVSYILMLGLAWSLVVGGLLVRTDSVQAAGGTPQLQLVEVATGFDQPTDVVSAGDDRLFVTEKGGLIRIINGDGTIRPTPFLDLPANLCTQSETGLLGLVFHPDYATNGFFFINYNLPPAGGSCDQPLTLISRFSVSADPNVADPASERVILTVQQPYDNHNAGDLAFGPDGYLYIPLGDGGSGGDPGNRSQDGSTLLGKMLRIDPTTGTGTEPNYTIPPTNPFISDPNVLDEIWALGLRNPWRISFDSLTGDLWISDVGQGSREEVNFQPASSTGGENWGWRCYEGTVPYNTTGCGPQDSYDGPATDYPRSDGSTVTGGYVYRGSQFPGMVGHYLFADFGSGNYWSLTPDGSGGWTRTLLLQGNSPVTFGEDQNGELYVAEYGFGDGTVYQLTDATPTAVTLSNMGASAPGLPMLFIWGAGSLLAMGLALARIVAIRRTFHG